MVYEETLFNIKRELKPITLLGYRVKITRFDILGSHRFRYEYEIYRKDKNKDKMVIGGNVIAVSINQAKTRIKDEMKRQDIKRIQRK